MPVAVRLALPQRRLARARDAGESVGLPAGGEQLHRDVLRQSVPQRLQGAVAGALGRGVSTDPEDGQPPPVAPHRTVVRLRVPVHAAQGGPSLRRHAHLRPHAVQEGRCLPSRDDLSLGGRGVGRDLQPRDGLQRVLLRKLHVRTDQVLRRDLPRLLLVGRPAAVEVALFVPLLQLLQHGLQVRVPRGPLHDHLQELRNLHGPLHERREADRLGLVLGVHHEHPLLVVLLGHPIVPRVDVANHKLFLVGHQRRQPVQAIHVALVPCRGCDWPIPVQAQLVMPRELFVGVRRLGAVDVHEDIAVLVHCNRVPAVGHDGRRVGKGRVPVTLGDVGRPFPRLPLALHVLRAEVR
mmetsp:Transcript_4490/g.7945  ORF Transcript_4490/g.7945 Transcript_4490/m.7945 type:complete len:351 (-) Transcript_4490:548-1600(-)